IKALTILCDWPGCKSRLTYDFGILRPTAPGWKTGTDGVYSMHLCPDHNRKTFDKVREEQFRASVTAARAGWGSGSTEP
ncbi:MAG: hypothetical protein MUF06_12565, partial [Pirellulaceae bacterium]|nr:hypothetical protein [Pirellulaceae bacterium]